MKIKTIVLISLLILGFSSSAMARSYVGASGGLSTVDESGFKVGFTQKVFAGLRHQDSGLEVAFINFGDFKAKDGSGTIKATGIALAVMPYFPLNRTFEFFGKIGGTAWNGNSPTGNAIFTSNDGFSYNLGLGANLNIFRHFSLRLELQKYYQIGSDSSGANGSAISTATAGAVFVF